MNNNIKTYFKNRRRRRLFKQKREMAFGAMMWLNHGAVVLLLLSYLAAYVSPASVWFIAFLGLTYPLWVLFNICFIIFWLVLIPKRALYSFLILLCGWSHIFSYAQLSDLDQLDGSDIKVMSYNVKLFDLYNWSHNTENRNQFFNLIKQQNADILCLQEFYTSEATYPYRLNNLDTLLKIQKAKNVYTYYTTTLRNTDHWGGAIFSTYPIINKGDIKLNDKSNNLCMYCDIVVNADTVRVYNLHLQSVHFKKDDYKFWDDLMSNNDTEEVEKSKNILRRLKLAYIKRSLQADTIASHISQSPYPVVVCGDFNDTPSSYAYNTISENLKDAFIQKGNGFGRTYAGKFPSFRIDYILHNEVYNATFFEVIQESFSDHYPIVARLKK